MIPVGPVGGEQALVVLRKDADGSTVMRTVIAVRFVPLTRER